MEKDIGREPPLFTVKTLAEFFGKHPQTVKQWIYSGKIHPDNTMGGTLVFLPETVEEFRKEYMEDGEDYMSLADMAVELGWMKDGKPYVARVRYYFRERNNIEPDAKYGNKLLWKRSTASMVMRAAGHPLPESPEE